VRLFFNTILISKHAAGRDWYFVLDKSNGELRIMFRAKAVIESLPATKFLISKEEKSEKSNGGADVDVASAGDGSYGTREAKGSENGQAAGSVG
jgi:hypothetical protein